MQENKISDLRNFGVAFSDNESNWPKKLKKEMTKKTMAIVFSHLKGFNKIKFVYLFMLASRKAKKADYSAIEAKGMSNKDFLETQIKYVSMFSALSQIFGVESAISIAKEIMDNTAKEALLLALPEIEKVKAFDNPIEVFAESFKASAISNVKAGCIEMEIVEDTDSEMGFDVTYCVWFELAKLLDTPKACIANCYADDLVYPEYFASVGIDYSRTCTLVNGCSKCDFKFTKQ